MHCNKNIGGVVVEGANKVKKHVSIFTDVINSLKVDEGMRKKRMKKKMLRLDC